jgi:hypothetical protein
VRQSKGALICRPKSQRLVSAFLPSALIAASLFLGHIKQLARFLG